LRRGPGDPTYVTDPDGTIWKGWRTPQGPVTLSLRNRGGEVLAAAWGPGAEWVLDGLPTLLGADDDPSTFVPEHPVLAEAWRRHPHWRVPRTRLVLDALVPAILEQKVTGKEARAAFRRLVLQFGAPAPGPAPLGMRVPPSAETWRRIPSWEWHRAAVDPQRSRTICLAMRYAARLDEAVGMERDEAARRLSAVPGVGVWTVAEVAQRALGDTDALSVGDYHLSSFVGWALAGRPLDDDAMVELLEPWRPHRYRVVRLLECSGYAKPRFGPRTTVQDHRGH
jgi:3-methyladenine DNA glycosylase/8-oxoguanine DNA glycosylase